MLLQDRYLITPSQSSIDDVIENLQCEIEDLKVEQKRINNLIQEKKQEIKDYKKNLFAENDYNFY